MGQGNEQLAQKHERMAAEATARNMRRIRDEVNGSDCAASYVADGLTAERHHLEAQIARDGGVSQFSGLFSAKTGRRIKARMIVGRYGLCWALLDESDGIKGFAPVADTIARTRNLKRKGFVQKSELAPACVRIRSNGTGMSGLASAYVRVERADGGYPPGSEIAD